MIWTSKYFDWDEVVDSQYAIRHGIDNEPAGALIPNILETAKQMDALREYLQSPVIVSSWFRCPELNLAIGSNSRSDHPEGWCVDFTSPRFGSVHEVFTALRKAPFKFDQLILECGRWVHISFNPIYRGQVLTWNGKSYRLLEVRP